jgi:hypothetical protein
MFTLVDGMDPGVPHHVVVRWQGYYFDGDGASTGRGLAQRWRRYLAKPKLIPGIKPRRFKQSGLVCPAGVVRKLKVELAQVLFRQ